MENTLTAQGILTTQGMGTGTIGGGMYGTPTIVSINVTEVRVEVVYRAKPNFLFAVAGPGCVPKDRVWKKAWEVLDGKLKGMPDIEGTHTPSYQVPERIDFA